MERCNKKIKKAPMYAGAIGLLSLLFICAYTKAGAQPTPIKGQFESQLKYSAFTNPPSEYRSFPFYSLNDKLDTAETKRQIDEFKQAGFGGFYLHSRDGLITDFLSDDWWQIMDAAVDAANKSGLHAMFYDEDKWPSGYAGGIVPKTNEEYRAKCLARLKKETHLPLGSKVLKEDSSYRYIEYTAQLGNSKFNGTSYVDLMNPNMVKDFLDISYKPYIEKYKQKITDYTFGIFSDEPHIHARYFAPKTLDEGLYSYSPYVLEKFKKLFGYDFLDKVELLFEEKDNWREVRLQYHQAVALQFEESFTKQISEFCGANGIKYTGHYLAEDVLEKVRDRAGNTMLHYRDMQQPGMDLLGLGFEGKLITARALSSVANQYDTPRRLTEIFALSGQNMSFEDRKWLAGWHSVLGVNHFCPHLILYSMTGLRKRDYPPTFSYHQPYWKYNKKLEDYLGRISYASTIGRYAPQILVINPLESEFVKGENEGAFTKQTLDLLEQLQETHYDYDLGDEQIIADIAKTANGNCQVGAMNYQTIILPDMIELRASTAKLLIQFAQQGGKIVYTGRFPVYFDGKENAKLQKSLQEKCLEVKIPVLKEKLPAITPPNVTIEGDTGDVWSQVRANDGGALIQLSNTSHTQPATFKLKSGLLKEHPILWDPADAKCFSITTDNNGYFQLQIEPSSNIWITSGNLSSDARNVNPYSLQPKTKPIVSLSNKWTGKKLAPNAFTLDFANYSTDGGKTFSAPEPVIGIFNRLSDTGFSGELKLSYPLQVEVVPTKASISVEHPEMFESILVNGKEIAFDKTSFFIDHEFKVADVSNLLKTGKNNIEMKLSFQPSVDTSEKATERYGTEIESIYLIGDFAVKGSTHSTTNSSQRNQSGNFIPRPVHSFSAFSVIKEDSVFDGDLVPEGYPFYAGAFELSQKFELQKKESGEHYFIEFPNTETIIMIVKVNGETLDTLCWAPFRTDITSALKEGANEVTVTLTNSLRNLLGPHHQQRAELIAAGPFSFGGSGGFPDPRGDSNWYDLRKTNSPMRIWTDTYYMVPFGFIEKPFISKEIK